MVLEFPTPIFFQFQHFFQENLKKSDFKTEKVLELEEKWSIKFPGRKIPTPIFFQFQHFFQESDLKTWKEVLELDEKWSIIYQGGNTPTPFFIQFQHFFLENLKKSAGIGKKLE